jgi:hypothetical protein
MLALFGGSSLWIGLTLVQGLFALPPWAILLGVAAGIAGLLYAYTRRCPGCGAGGVMTLRGPQRHCEECGTQFLNDRFF